MLRLEIEFSTVLEKLDDADVTRPAAVAKEFGESPGLMLAGLVHVAHDFLEQGMNPGLYEPYIGTEQCANCLRTRAEHIAADNARAGIIVITHAQADAIFSNPTAAEAFIRNL